MNTLLDNEETNNICQQFEGITNSIGLFKNQFNSLQQQLRVLEKTVKKQMKTLKKN